MTRLDRRPSLSRNTPRLVIWAACAPLATPLGLACGPRESSASHDASGVGGAGGVVSVGSAGGAGGAVDGSGAAASSSSSGGGSPSPKATPENLRVLDTTLLGRWTNTSAVPLAPLGMTGTDLGVSFERDGKLTFLFGDSWTLDKSRTDQDSTATTALGFPSDGSLPLLEWTKLPNGTFRALTVPTVNLSGMNVPVEGLVVGARTYVFFSTGYAAATKRHTHSVLAHSDAAALGGMTLDHKVKTDRFINVSVVREGDELFVYGSGPYRKSAIYLAKVNAVEVAKRAAWTFYKDGVFVAEEAEATPIIDAPCVGELSARKHPTLGMVLVTYNCDEPRGLWLHASATPTGPFAPRIRLVDPGNPAGVGYGHAIHSNESVVAYDDGLAEQGRETVWGGEYGPYLVPSWSAVEQDGVHDLVFAMSTWNPYQVSLVRSHLGADGVPFSPPKQGENLPKSKLVNGDFASGNLSGWQSSGDAFALYKDGNGAYRVTTHVAPKGDKAVGTLWQEFTVDSATSELRFWVHGGHASVKLSRGKDVLRETRGREQNEPELPVRWYLESLRGQTLRVTIDDQATDVWGFVGAGGFELL